eukprot:194960-Chlamydomonas_euryale.AAC.4
MSRRLPGPARPCLACTLRTSTHSSGRAPTKARRKKIYHHDVAVGLASSALHCVLVAGGLAGCEVGSGAAVPSQLLT